MKPLSEQQHRRLLFLGSGAMVVAPVRGDWGPLLRRGLVEPQCEDEGKRYLPPLRITPAGLRALAEGLERYGHEEIPIAQMWQRDIDPRRERLRQRLKDFEDRLRASESRCAQLERTLAAARRVLAP